MTRRTRELCVGAIGLVLAVAALACSRGATRDAPAPPPRTEALPETSAAPAVGAGVGPAHPGFDAVTRQKFSDQEYMAAIADLESDDAASDAAADRAAGHPRVLAFPAQSGGKIPGYSGSRAQLPPEVEIVRIAGIVEGTSNRHALRFEMLATRYAQDYNGTMVRSLR